MQAFNLNAENFSDMQEELERQLIDLKVAEKDILRAQLLVEEIFWRMVNLGKCEQVKVQVTKNFFGKVQIKLTATGASYNPLVEIADWEEDQDDEDYFSMMILKAHRQRLNWFHKNNLNVVTINVRSKDNTQTIITAACIFGGIICGLLMREFLSPEVIAVINETIIQPSTKMFLNALSLLITSVIFFSIISGMIGMSSVGVGKVGLKLMACSTTLGIIALLLSCIMAWIFFGGGVPQINTLPAIDSSAEILEFSFVKFILDIIPDNFVDPILNGNILQIIFVAILFGISLNRLGNEVSLVREGVDNLNKIFTNMMMLLMFFMPPIVFLAMVNLALATAAETLMLILKLLIGELIAAVLLIGFCPILIRCVGKISPKPFLKKFPELLPPSFATSSSGAVMPSMMNISTNKFGISPKISSFTIPFGVTFNTAGSLICIITASLMFLKMYSVETDFRTLVTIYFLAMLFSFGAPDFISVLTITSNFGVPMEKIATLMFCIDALSDRIGTCVNVVSNMAVATTLARTENLLDEKIYLTE